MKSQFPRPSTVQVGPFLYGVAYDERRINRWAVHYSEELFGHSDHMAQEILVHPNLHKDVSAETLLHELLHCCFHAAGTEFKAEKEEDLEENVVRSLSPILLDTLRRNPHVLEYLLGVSHGEKSKPQE